MFGCRIARHGHTHLFDRLRLGECWLPSLGARPRARQKAPVAQVASACAVTGHCSFTGCRWQRMASLYQFASLGDAGRSAASVRIHDRCAAAVVLVAGCLLSAVADGQSSAGLTRSALYGTKRHCLMCVVRQSSLAVAPRPRGRPQTDPQIHPRTVAWRACANFDGRAVNFALAPPLLFRPWIDVLMLFSFGGRCPKHSACELVAHVVPTTARHEPRHWHSAGRVQRHVASCAPC